MTRDNARTWFARRRTRARVAVLIDPETRTVVSAGRNRLGEKPSVPNVLGGNHIAHAEMNAFAGMTGMKADGLHLYTTVQPCFMCAAASVFLPVEKVFFAAVDEFFDGVHELWDHHPYSRRWEPAVVGPLERPMSSFARVLPMSRQALTPDSRVMRRAHERIPDIAALAIELATDRSLHRLRESSGTVTDVLADLWDRLPR